MSEDNTSVTPSIPPVDPSIASATPAEPTSAPVSEPVPEPEPAIPSIPKDAPVLQQPLSESTPVEVPAIYAEVASKIRDSQNVLIALSSDPSVDEMATAIGLSLYLDKLGKRATAIYSGTTPNALEFLKPEDTFESTADTLQDFVIAINKEKADHLRYKLDGDFVKIYITPYRTRISQEDLDFSYGDFNVDLVIALDVANGIDLDAALREHGRIMHDAVIINVTTGNPGKFGEIEWSDKSASSVAEMISKLLYSTADSNKIDKEEATAFLTGIVAATNRFSNAATTPETMQISSKLMKSGANQQLVSKNITPDTENESFTVNEPASNKEPEDPTKLAINHKDNEELSKEAEKEVPKEEGSKEEAPNEKLGEKEPESTSSEATSDSEKDTSLMEDLKAAEASLSQTGAETTPEDKKTSLQIDSENKSSNLDEITKEPQPAPELQLTSEPQSEPSEKLQAIPQEESTEPTGTVEEPIASPEKIIKPSNDFGGSADELENEQKYSKMLEDALESVSPAPAIPEEPIVSPAEPVSEASAPQLVTIPPEATSNPAAASAPAVPVNPEINGVPEMNYMPLPDQEILPPPPAPPIDMSNMIPVEQPAPQPPIDASSVAPTEQPAPQSPTDPSAFKIPGM